MADTNDLLRQQLGNAQVIIYVTGDGAQTSLDCYAVHFPVQSVVTNLDIDNNTGTDANLHQTYPAGTMLYLNVTAITISSGLAILYKN